MANEMVVKLLDGIIDSLDIPESYYKKAADRHRSLGEWFCRPDSKIASFQPHVTPQGSFRYGTVVRPLDKDGEYDLDNVVTLALAKTALTQKQLKALLGEEIRAYAEAHQMLSPIEEMNRCWRLHYADEVTFHLDSLPCVAEEKSVIAAIKAHGVSEELAKRAVAITDKRHPSYNVITSQWLSSNPRGFARWFEESTRGYALQRLRRLVEARLYNSVEDVPAYEWKTPLQRSIQLLKRHRDVMFQENAELAPISMIITNLATHAYKGELDVFAAVTGIVDRMPSFIRPNRPRIPNPADPAEDYADKWSTDPQLEQNFWEWHTQAKADLARLPDLLRGDRLAASVRNMFRVDLTQEQLRQFQPVSPTVRTVVSTAPAIAIASAPRPWGHK
ncbi:MAG TPA: nucleotidyltransferase [Terracidiphilus sp.]|nr:nucleotidyltransferase [Terracidiphilus sp.]